MSASKSRVLVVEDDADCFEWVRRRLARYGYDVDWAATVGEAFGKLEVGPAPSFSDLAMPDGSGTSILRAVRGRGLPIKVAVVSGSDGLALYNEAARLNPDRFFQKPVDAIELMAWLRAVCP